MPLSVSLTRPVPQARPDNRRWWALAIVVAAQFIFVVNTFSINVAIPSIRADLHATTGEIQGVIVLYQVAFATLILAGGRLGDIRGPKLAFLIGLMGFCAASLWCALARSGVELVTGRAMQGAAAALMIPQVLAVMHLLFRDGARGRAFGIYGFALGFGAAAGFGLGGWLVALDVARLGWRMIFIVNVPVCVLLMGATTWSIPFIPGKPDTRFDLIGAAMLVVALLCLMGPLTFGSELGSAPWMALLMLTGLFLLAFMWPLERWVEVRRNGFPLVPLALLGNRNFTTGLLAVLFFNFANVSFYLAITLYMQGGLGFSPLQAGTAFLPGAIAFAVASGSAGPRAQRRGIVALLEGCGVQLAGLAIAGIAAALHTPSAIACLLVVFGVGQAMVMAPLYGLVLAKVPPGNAGSGAGVVSTVQQIGNAGGAAVVGAMYFAVQAAHPASDALLACLAILAIALTVTTGLLQVLRRAPIENVSHTGGV